MQTMNNKLRVAVYCRISTPKKDEQHLRYEAQKAFYADKIKSNPDWQMVGIYADEGLRSAQAVERPEFMRMIDNCKDGKIDLIVTKSLTRFARNTLDSIEYIRLLRSMGIGVFFEIQNINTLKLSSELFLTLYVAMTQSESESISNTVLWC